MVCRLTGLRVMMFVLFAAFLSFLQPITAALVLAVVGCRLVLWCTSVQLGSCSSSVASEGGVGVLL